MKLLTRRGRNSTSTLLSSMLVMVMVANPILAENRQPVRAVSAVAAHTEAPTQAEIRDFALDNVGMLRGKVLDRQGKPVANSPVVLINGRSEVKQTQSNAQGDFQFQVAKAGVHQVSTGGDTVTCRLWTSTAAPPAAKKALLLCGSDQVVRGQCGSCQGCKARRRSCDPCTSCQTCNHGGGAASYGYEGGGNTMAPPVPRASQEELRALAPDLPGEQFAALTRADIVIANPDHYSVAIQFDGQGGATVVAKGVDNVALQMQAVARNGGIPVGRNVQLAQALYNQVEVGGAVPANLLAQINQIMASLQPAVSPSVGTYDPGYQQQGSSGVGGNPLVLGAIIAAAVAIPIAVSDDDDAS